LIAHETLIYLNNQFEVEAWGDVPLRGKQNPVRIYRVLGKKP
jgi:adenylate cyclase